MRKIICLFAILTAVSGCRTAFTAAQEALAPYKIYVKANGNIESATNFTYAYAEGTGSVEVGYMDIKTGTAILSYKQEGAIAKGWILVMTDDNKPKVLEVPIADAKTRLNPAS